MRVTARFTTTNCDMKCERGSTYPTQNFIKNVKNIASNEIPQRVTDNIRYVNS